MDMFCSDLMAEMSRKLNQTEETLAQLTVDDNSTDTKLDSLKEDAQKLERTVKELMEQVEFIKNSDVRGWQPEALIIHHNKTLVIQNAFSMFPHYSPCFFRGFRQHHQVSPAVLGGRGSC